MITFSKDLLTLNPAYNDSIIQFESTTITGATRAMITIEGMSFVSVPNNEKFTFNFKEIIKSIINTNRLEDTIIPDLSDEFLYPDGNIVKTFQVDITVFNLTSNESITKNYKFSRSVEQLMNYKRLININAPIKILLPTQNFIDYTVRVFEGYPFDFGIYGIGAWQTYYFKNLTTNQRTGDLVNNHNHVTRVFLSDGANSTTELDVLVQSSTLNKLELWVDDNFTANINILKMESDCGIYLKWLNSRGSYSYWKFNSVYKSTITPKTIDDFEGRYDNLQNLTATSYLIGKTATQTIAVESNYTDDDANYLADLVTSPHVQMYSHTTPFNQQQEFDFIGVKVSDTAFIPLDTKRNKNKMKLTITLPALNTITN